MNGLYLSLILSALGIVLLIGDHDKSFYMTLKVDHQNTLALTFLGILGAALIVLTGNFFIVLLLATVFFNPHSRVITKAGIQGLKRNLFKISSMTFLKFWPVLLIASLVSAELLSEFPAQSSVTELRGAEFFDKSEIIFSALLIAPISEEIVFRAMLYRGLKAMIGVLPAITSTSLLFALVHMNISSFFVLFLLGIFLCYIFEKTGSIYSSILCHLYFNLIMIALIFIK